MTLLELENVTKDFAVNAGIIPRLLGTDEQLHAVQGVSLSLDRGEAFGLVGESGAGKSTIGNLIVRIHEPTSGRVLFEGEDVHKLRGADLKAYRQSVQMVFQDPHSSLDPRYKVGKSIAEPLKIHTDMSKSERQDRVAELLRTVNLEEAHRDRYPHELSGGQLQRVSIATALSVEPELLILDEPVSALDVSVQARILNLLSELQDELDLTFLFISHDLSVVRHITSRLGIMYLGDIVETGPTEELFDSPAHPYTKGLVNSIPAPDPATGSLDEALTGEIPSPVDPPSGCSFHPRCAYATEECAIDEPSLSDVRTGRQAACHHWQDVYDETTSDD